MGAPSDSHEERVGDLETLATLAGYTADFALPWRLRPDVIRACCRRRSLFVGDAKATESPACSATAARLRWYVCAVATLTPPVRETTLGLAVPGASASGAWERLLLAAVGSRMVLRQEHTTTSFGETTVVAVRVRLW